MREHFQYGVRWSESIATNSLFIQSLLMLSIYPFISPPTFIWCELFSWIRTNTEFTNRDRIRFPKIDTVHETLMLENFESRTSNPPLGWQVEGSFLAHTLCCIVPLWMQNACSRLDYIHGSRVSNLPASSRCYYFTCNITLLSCLITGPIIHTYTVFTCEQRQCVYAFNVLRIRMLWFETEEREWEISSRWIRHHSPIKFGAHENKSKAW